MVILFFNEYKKQDYQRFMNVLYRCSVLVILFFLIVKTYSDDTNRIFYQ